MIDRSNEGRRVRLVYTSDRYTHLRPGDQGTYEYEIKASFHPSQHSIKWDDGSSLMLLGGVDSFEFLTPKPSEVTRG